MLENRKLKDFPSTPLPSFFPQNTQGKQVLSHKTIPQPWPFFKFWCVFNFKEFKCMCALKNIEITVTFSILYNQNLTSNKNDKFLISYKVNYIFKCFQLSLKGPL